MTNHLPANFSSRSIGGYLGALANGSPTPGGGSAAGLAGALGCSLGEMVCQLSLAKQENDTLASLATKFAEMTEHLIALAARDELAFGSYRSAVAMPRSNDKEKAARLAAIELALVGAADVPLEACGVGIAAIGYLSQTAVLGTAHALGDLMTGGFLLQAMVLGSLENVVANTELMKVAENRERFERAAQASRRDLELGMVALSQSISARRG